MGLWLNLGLTSSRVEGDAILGMCGSESNIIAVLAL